MLFSKPYPQEKLDALIEKLSPGLVLSVARLVARTRPVGTYPGWYFALAEDNPTPMRRFRLAIWRYCNRRRLQEPIIMKWHSGTRMRVYLGNDASKCLFVGGCIEPNEFAFIDACLAPGMVMVDIGANAGLYALHAAGRVGPSGTVVAIEPSRRDFRRLRENLDLNGLANVRTFCAALSHRNGEGILQVAKDEHEGVNTLGAFVHPGVFLSHAERVRLMRLDDLLGEQKVNRVDIVKIDVEGAELSVLRGAQQTLQAFRPLLLVELCEAALRHQGGSSDQVLELLRSMGYVIYVFDDATGRPVPAGLAAQLSENVVAAHPARTWPGLNERPGRQ